MGHKQKGQLTTDIERYKHLRKIGKRIFWKGERMAEKKVVSQDLHDSIGTAKIPILTFDSLFDLIEKNEIKNELDRKIAEIILDAETDWIISIYSLNDFLVVLEKEINGETTKKNLEKQLKKYNRNIAKYAWESESISALLEIFDHTEEPDLRTIFFNLTEKLK
jgi:hypothetical protein